MDSATDLNTLTPEQLRQLSGELLGALAARNKEVQDLTKRNQQLATEKQQLVTEKQLSAHNSLSATRS